MSFITSYTPEWKTEFEHLKKVLIAELSDIVAEPNIQHIGSTAIPELISKPILDVDIIIDDEQSFARIEKRLEILGYQSKGEQGITGRFAFRQRNNLTPLTPSAKRWQQHHLYVCYKDSLALKNHLLFRDALMGSKVLRDSYSTLKKQLADHPGITRETYAKEKTEFIIDVLANAGLNAEDLATITQANS